MTKISKIASLIRANTTQLNFGGGIKGVIVKENDPEDVHDIFFGYESLNDNINVGFYVTFMHVLRYIHRKTELNSHLELPVGVCFSCDYYRNHLATYVQYSMLVQTCI